MKREYARPELFMEEFVASEYVAACRYTVDIYEAECENPEHNVVKTRFKVDTSATQNGIALASGGHLAYNMKGTAQESWCGLAGEKEGHIYHHTQDSSVSCEIFVTRVSHDVNASAN